MLKPLVQLGAEDVLKLNHCVFLLFCVPTDFLEERVVLVLANFSLDREVAESNQVSVENLFVYHVCGLVKDERVAEDQANEQT